MILRFSNHYSFHVIRTHYCGLTITLSSYTKLTKFKTNHQNIGSTQVKIQRGNGSLN